MSPFFSIIIPAYNRASLIGNALHSLKVQSFSDFEALVIDDGSTDNTEEVVSGWLSPCFHYHKKENAERGAARNFGLHKAQGQYITFLDSDDVVYPHYFQQAKEAIEHYQNPPFLHLGYEVVDEHMRPLTKVNYLQSDDIHPFIKGNPLSCTGVFLRNDIADQFLFREDRDLAGSEDWELWIRIAANVGIKTDNRIAAALINHDSRSVKHYSKQKLIRRKELAMAYAFEDQAVRKAFAPYLKKINSYWDSYIALHLVLSGNLGSGLSFWLHSMRQYPLSLFERRSAAIFKHLILQWLHRS
jgi:glycosyltransferase involved in cell wall biosynthesis